MPVALVSRVRSRDLRPTKLRRTAQRLLDAAGCPKASLSITLVGDAAIRKLNREYRHKDRSTDVLSFPLGDGAQKQLLGDVVISVATAKRQAAEYDATLEREIERLLIHGILHLLGHDHHERSERLRMEREERRLARSIGMPWPY
ncbi:MAG TPA: rRNA maturation RNase YbeY [Candidatus Acidoferrales bacterium]|nr:rRNA maturation RNase YbeY [Candidatus Acidoferrales bacterium]